MNTIPLTLLAIGVAVPLYAYVGYPLVLKLLAGLRSPRRPAAEPADWPQITVCVPAYNEEAVIAETLENWLQADYPPDRMHILVLSDASTDRTDEIVRSFADRGVELLRMPERVGKTEAENLALPRLRGTIIVNSDAAVRVAPNSLKPLVAAFESPDVGVASGRDVSVGEVGGRNAGESRYVGYEMGIRSLETTVDGIVGASGCYYAIRRELHATRLPPSLSRDFAAALVARQAGYRSVAVDEAVCVVPRSGSLRTEYRRKVRTIARGLRTLHHERSLLNPLRYGLFAWMLFSHKLCRWLVPWAAVTALAAIAVLALHESWARWLLGGLVVVAAGAALGATGKRAARASAAAALLTFFFAGNLAVLHAWLRALTGERDPSWEPTRRPAVSPGDP